MRSLIVLSAAVLTLFVAATAQAFCGFYVAKADSELFNEASQVVLVRDGKRTVITMVNDFKGDVSEFAMVVPVPTFIEREQINVGSQAVVDHLDAYTAPRLVEYFDSDPCQRVVYEMASPSARMDVDGAAVRRQKSLGVTVEASYTVGEYDILILSAKESNGLITWLNENEYRIPDGAERVIGSYLKQGMRFFVAKVNLEEQQKSGFSNLRPLQVAFESEKFMLPIRLGTLNARGKQDMYVYTLTRTGRVETTNYRTVRLPSNVELPVHVKGQFGDFYRTMFAKQSELANERGVFLEYAWDMAWCDPCAADPLTADELRSLGVFWLDKPGGKASRRGAAPLAQDVFVTRLHVRYDAEHFPEDLMLQETGDRENFQGRYIVRHAFEGADTCGMAEEYRASLIERQEREAKTLANLTGWDINDIRAQIPGLPIEVDEPWWKAIWN
ncbi:MAG: DUF2330 domain-containing protein [Woeseiaceae bacterium]|nr:DUF2330 domain-containing protein [Woeseiaceae bacterium]